MFIQLWDYTGVDVSTDNCYIFRARSPSPQRPSLTLRDALRFLGLGLPWTIGSIYWAAQGRTSAWQEKYASKAAAVFNKEQGGSPQKSWGYGWFITARNMVYDFLAL